MKTWLTLILAAATMVAFSSCRQEEDIDLEDEDRDYLEERIDDMQDAAEEARDDLGDIWE